MNDRAGRVLLVDDDERLLRLLSIRLEREAYEVRTARNAREALAILPVLRPQLMITDMRMEGMDGMALYDVVHAQEPTLPVVILTAHGTIPDAVEATQRGLFAYLTKPFDGEELMRIVRRAMALSGAGTETASSPDPGWRSHIVTRSAAVDAVLDEAQRVARSDASVLVLGQSGTGKELLARAIHNASARHEQPFVPVNCTAIPEALLESELFGHRRGAFTGASSSRRGLFIEANGGTLFLDEIGDMPLPFQAKLLRALQEREIRPVGSDETRTINVRVVSATHRRLDAAVAARTFREDLYYRLNVVTLELPPLCNRREDIPVLARHFLTEIGRAAGINVQGFARDALERLIAAPWPGNVRQLRNVVEHCVVLATGPLIPATLVDRALQGKPKELLPFHEARRRFELDYLVNLLRMTEGNVAQAARLAERNRSELYKLLRRHLLDPQLFRPGEDTT